MKRTRYSRVRVRTAVRGLAVAVLFWAVAFGLSVPLGARWPEGFPRVDIERNALAGFPMANGEPMGPHPPVYRAGQAEVDAWVWFGTLVLAATFLWLQCWMMWHFTPRWGGLERSILAAEAIFMLVYLRFLGAMLYPEFGRDVQFWRWAQRVNVWLLIAALVAGLWMTLLIADEEPDHERDNLEAYRDGAEAGFKAGQVDVAERIETGRVDGHAAGRAAERMDAGPGR